MPEEKSGDPTVLQRLEKRHFRSIGDVLAYLFYFHIEAYQKLVEAGGWRGLWDTPSAEYNKSLMPQKVDALKEVVRATGLRLDQIFRWYSFAYEKERPDIVMASADGLADMCQYLMESSEIIVPD